MKTKSMYMLVSNDKYELPMTPPMLPEELATHLGIHISTLFWRARCQGGVGKNKTRLPKIVKVKLAV